MTDAETAREFVEKGWQSATEAGEGPLVRWARGGATPAAKHKG